MIYIESRKKAEKTLKKQYPNALIIDVTSKGNHPYIKFSPFYPHGNIPIPFSEGYFAETVEGIWQGLKVFENEGIDPSKFTIKNMSGIKRTVRKFGKPLGHRQGINGSELLDYISARKKIYMRAYAYILENRVKSIVDELGEKAHNQDIILLDYDTNEDIENAKKPLSHASLVKKHLEFRFPILKTLVFNSPIEKNINVKSSRQKKKDTVLNNEDTQTNLFKK
jgi:hypothetical protein